MAVTARRKQRASEAHENRAPTAATRRRDNALARIRKLIAQLKLGPGDRLPGERQLAAKFNLSRGTIREALQFLAALSLVEIRHGGGCFCERPPATTNRCVLAGVNGSHSIAAVC